MGPTPVSALLHAATMVTAGVYLLFRLLPTFEIPSFIIYFGSMIGILTIILGGLIAFSQFDYKKIIAYSTCSQLGFMFYSLFINLPSFSFFHLFIHGFFKALLFLSAGLLIHNLSNNQDSRKFSNLIFFFPFSYILFLAGSLSIISFP
jgi:NADH:ubiquinone oxidoreductase subunit 5 (subunit L)/multisubunit Na+/H+ antiporter MnhA subunit